MTQIHDDTVCLLGEGPLWHPGRGELFWFDILARRLHTKGRHWQFDEIVSAAGWVDDDTLLIASQSSLSRFTLSTGAHEVVAPLEADIPRNRSNDGRADPWGGFWIGTMSMDGEAGAGSIWRFAGGTLTKVVDRITISNSICFSPDRRFAFYADTPTRQIMRLALDPADGAPVGEAEVHVDLTGDGPFPDGAVVDTDGTLWCAHWGSGCITGYAPDGTSVRTIDVPGVQATCPAFGGPDLRTMYVTSAAAGLSQEVLADQPLNGQTFVVETGTTGQAEHRVLL